MTEMSVKPQLLNKYHQWIQSYFLGHGMTEPFGFIHLGWKEPLGYVYFIKLNIPAH